MFPPHKVKKKGQGLEELVHCLVSEKKVSEIEENQKQQIEGNEWLIYLWFFTFLYVISFI